MNCSIRSFHEIQWIFRDRDFWQLSNEKLTYMTDLQNYDLCLMLIPIVVIYDNVQFITLYLWSIMHAYACHLVLIPIVVIYDNVILCVFFFNTSNSEKREIKLGTSILFWRIIIPLLCRGNVMKGVRWSQAHFDFFTQKNLVLCL